MNRRAFFRSLALGSTAVLPALRTVSTPPARLAVLSGHYTGQVLHVTDWVKLRAATIVERCHILFPWRAARWYGRTSYGSPACGFDLSDASGIRIVENFITTEPAPLWARLLRLGAR